MRGKLIIIIAIVVVVLLAGGGAGYWYFMMRPSHTTAQKAKPPKKKLFVSLKPMVVSVEGQSQFGLSSGTTYLQIGFEFETVHQKALQAFNDLRPAIRGKVLTLLLNLSPDVLHQQDVRTKMKQKVLGVVNKTIADNEPDVGKQSFEQVYITNFVTQSG